MAITSTLVGSSQNAAPATPLGSSTPGAELLNLSENTEVAEQQNASNSECFLATLQVKFFELFKENRRLHEQLEDGQSREREMSVLHQKELAAAQQKIEALGQEVARAKNLCEEIDRQRKDSNKIGFLFQKYLAPIRILISQDVRALDLNSWLTEFEIFIRERTGRKIDLDKNAAQQNADTERLKELASEIMLSIKTAWPFPAPATLPPYPSYVASAIYPYNQQFQTELNALIEERNSRKQIADL